MNTKTLLPSVLFTALLAASQMAVAQDASTSANATADAAASANVPEAQLAERYAELDGSTEAAAGLVQSLHDGTADGTAMAYGEIDTALALSGALVESGNAANLDAAVDTVTALRAEGMGWGRVAQDLDLDLGAAVSAAHRVDVASQAEGRAAAGASSAEVAQAGVSGVVNAATTGVADARAGVGRAAAADARVGAGIEVGVGARDTTPNRSNRPTGAEVGVGIGVGAGASSAPVRPERPVRGGGLLGGGLL